MAIQYLKIRVTLHQKARARSGLDRLEQWGQSCFSTICSNWIKCDCTLSPNLGILTWHFMLQTPSVYNVLFYG